MTDGGTPGSETAASAVSSILRGRMPDITPAQLVGVIGAVLAVAISFGANISREQQEAILALAAAVAAILFAADAHVRSHRAHAEATRHVADQHAATVQKVLDQHAQATEQAVKDGVPAPTLVFPPPATPPSQ